MVNGTGIHKKGTFSLHDLLKSIRDRSDSHKAGALAVFVGVVRGETSDGENVKKLKLEAYEEKANEVLENICENLKKREGVIDVQIHHFVGEFDVGEDLVYVVVAGAHRQNVFQVLEEAVERYKKEAPIFKKEYVVNKEHVTNSRWVSEHKTL
ncbi:MAG: molybdenum cofactor biosynthesis protein MoaE [Candidatus Bathyarchaeota archaeon]|nr:MAG: molybdenum cofactor biosynthesis protein MoaE [Candidatus Bathyarchaeota archaeon]